MNISNHGTALDFEQSGAGPAIVFIHDGQDNRSITEERFASLVKAGFRIVITNLRNLSQCGEATVDDLTGDVIALFNYLGIGRAVIFGIGRGSCILLNLLEKHPERIAGSSLVIPPAMIKSLNRFAGRKGLLKRLRTEGAAPLIRKLFNAVPATPAATPILSELPGLSSWLDQAAKLSRHPDNSGLALLAELQLPLLLIDTPTTSASRRWRQCLGNRLRAFNSSFLAILDLLMPEENEEFDEEVCGSSH